MGPDVCLGRVLRTQEPKARSQKSLNEHMITRKFDLLTQSLKSRTLRVEKKAAQFYSSAGPPSGWFNPNRKSASGAAFLHSDFDTLRRSTSDG